jgi:hypothetical protein
LAPPRICGQLDQCCRMRPAPAEFPGQPLLPSVRRPEAVGGELRPFDSFDAAAAEAAVSRLYGGIHFAFDNYDGLASGHCIGQAITDRVRFRNEDDE